MSTESCCLGTRVLLFLGIAFRRGAKAVMDDVEVAQFTHTLESGK